MKSMKIYLIVLFMVGMLFASIQAPAKNWLKYIHFGNYGSDEYVEGFSQAKAALDNLINQYESKNILRMMDCVSESYTTDKAIFEDNLRSEFSRYAFVEMRYYVDKVLFDSKNENVLITVTYIKRVQERSTADLKVVNGTSDLIFKKENGKYLLWKMQPKFMGN